MFIPMWIVCVLVGIYLLGFVIGSGYLIYDMVRFGFESSCSHIMELTTLIFWPAFLLVGLTLHIATILDMFIVTKFYKNNPMVHVYSEYDEELDS